MPSPPGRRVHWEETNQILSPALPPLSPTSPVSSRGFSTPSPSTPPSPNPFRHIPLPDVTEEVADAPAVVADVVHVKLRRAVDGERPPVKLNFIGDVSNAISKALPGAEKDEPATNPPMKRIKVQCGYLPWTMEITPSSLNYVTVEDLLAGVCQNLRTTVLDGELRGDDKKRTNLAFQSRCEVWNLDPLTAKHIRADFLEMNRLFNGFKVKRRGVLRLSVMPE